ncbi:putative membrane protein required for colicin V production [Salsuginibacillus halophilus]|uniref:Putative membrane protein required for colicin V production n=1 Tax=Salsuginibacillus halophilus TaxID=517424 RepID=A0A2P8HCS7_9BACI|nr:CvpA family protein [Salsuginibacillus halophilus]PSL44040.1 putative membrane protein required for colicin V production [Salsuginibacillus halophilus]
MLSLIILLILIGSFFIGLRRGFILQAIHLVSFFAALIVAFIFYDDLAEHLVMLIPYPDFLDPADGEGMLLSSFYFEDVYYNGISFALLFFLTKIVLQIIGSMLDFVSTLPVLRTVNWFLGGVLGFIETYLILFVVFIVALLLPVDFIQSVISDSLVARLMVENTPFLSDWLYSLWVDER